MMIRQKTENTPILPNTSYRFKEGTRYHFSVRPEQDEIVYVLVKRPWRRVWLTSDHESYPVFSVRDGRKTGLYAFVTDYGVVVNHYGHGIYQVAIEIRKVK